MRLYCPLGAFVIVSGSPANAWNAKRRPKIRRRDVFIVNYGEKGEREIRARLRPVIKNSLFALGAHDKWSSEPNSVE